MTPLLVIPAEVDLAPVYFGTALVLGLVVFIMAVAWATRATAVAALAVGICLAGGAVLAVSTAWLADIDGPLSPGDAVVLRFIVAMFLGLVVLSVLLGRRCWKAERARPSVPAFSTARPRSDEYDRDWILSLLQEKTRLRREKVSTSAAVQPTEASAQQSPSNDNILP
ncbi:MAG: hypothetical protein H0T47_05980 [Planctomycetaceae bacterium]|nr:hypothetical protein [Planctomycetaceae bacterium]